MIKINLTPYEELENPLWWVPDVLLAITVSLCGYFGTQFYLSDSKEKIEQLTKELSSLEEGTKTLASDVKKYNELDNDNKTLNSKLTSLGKLTASDVIRYKPVILLEHLQNLSPLGVWFTSVTFGKDPMDRAGENQEGGIIPPANKAVTASKASTEAEHMVVKGIAFDNLLVAEFLAALRATQTQDVDPKDLRTHVYFSEIKLILTEMQTGNNPFIEDQTISPDLSLSTGMASSFLPTFEIQLEVREHKVEKPKGDLAQL